MNTFVYTSLDLLDTKLKKILAHLGRVYALTRVGTLLTRVARKGRGLVPEC